MKLTSKERMSRILKHQPVDRIGLFEVFWRETAVRWAAEGHFEKPEMVSDHSVSNLVNYETYKFFVETGLKIGTY